MAAVPSLYRQILKYCDLQLGQLSSLRHCLTAGEPLPGNIAEQWAKQAGCQLYEALGMSEISTYISSSPARANKQGSPGKPQSGRCIAILPQEGGTDPLPVGQSGVIAIHRTDPGLMLGYWNRPEEESAAMSGDWFLSGDLALMDDQGFIWFTGRDDDLINAKGYRVSPMEVEAALIQHSDIEQVAVVSVNVGENIDIIAAFLVTKADKDIDENDIFDFARQRLAAYKAAKEVTCCG